MVRQMVARMFVTIWLISSTMGQVTGLPEFEVATIRPHPPGGRLATHEAIAESLQSSGTIVNLMSGLSHPSDQLRLVYVSLRELVRVAFKEVVPYRIASENSDYLKGGPSWLDSVRFDLIAKAPHNATFDEQRLMMQALLIDRFHLMFHREERLMPAYGLVAGKRGANLTSSESSGEPGCDRRPLKAASPVVSLVCHGVTMAFLAARLQYFVGQQVTDLTGIAGTYDVQLDIGPIYSDGFASSPTVFEALDKLGLKLEARKQLMPIIVIDHVDRVPTEN